MTEWLAKELQVRTPTDLSEQYARVGSESEDSPVDVERKVIVDYFVRELTKLGRVKRGVDRLGALLAQWKQSEGYNQESKIRDTHTHAPTWTTAGKSSQMTQKVAYRNIPCTMPMTPEEHAEFMHLKVALVELRESSPGVPHRALREYIASYLVESTGAFDDAISKGVDFSEIPVASANGWHSPPHTEVEASKYTYMTHRDAVRKAVGRNALKNNASLRQANNKLREEQSKARVKALHIVDARIRSVNEVFYVLVGWTLAWFYQFQDDEGMFSLKLDSSYLSITLVVGYLSKALLNRFVIMNLPISDAATGAEEPRLTVRDLGREIKSLQPDATEFDSRVYITLFANAEL